MSPVRGEHVTTVDRALGSLGISDEPIYRMVAEAVESFGLDDATVVDIGCGTGNLRRFLPGGVGRYVGADIVRYEGFPEGAEFVQTDLESGRVPLPDGAADICITVEVIEHVENPRALVRELVRLTRPGGWIVITTPNQLSFLSLLTLVVRGRFAAFQDVHYPAHLSALLEVDLLRIAGECGLVDAAVRFSLHDRIVLTPYHVPRAVAQLAPRRFSDTILLAARRPAETDALR